MEPDVGQGAYSVFLTTGKIQDYLSYIDATRQMENAALGENVAYHDRWDRPAGAGSTGC